MFEKKEVQFFKITLFARGFKHFNKKYVVII